MADDFRFVDESEIAEPGKPQVYWVVRYLPSRQVGEGDILFTICSTGDVTLAKLREAYPHVFEQRGFYSLMRSMDDYLDVKETAK